MKREKLIKIILASCCAVFLLASCKSSEKKEEPAPETPAVEEPVETEKEPEEPEEPEEDFSAANKELLAQVEEARAAAKEAGAELSQVEKWAATESAYNSCKDEIEGGSKKDLSSDLNTLKSTYEQMALDARSAANKALFESAEASRAAALAAGASDLDPDEWKKLEAEYEAIKAAIENGTDEDLSERIKALDAKYQELVSQALSGSNKAKLAQVEASRQAAIDAGAAELAPGAWAVAELEYNVNKKLVSEGTEDNLGVVLGDLNNRYQGLLSLTKAKNSKDKIDSNGLASYAQGQYDSATAILDELMSTSSIGGLTVSKDFTGADFKAKAESAASMYQNVIKTAYNAKAKEERTNAFKSKQKADSVKAYVSRKADYDEGVAAYKNGELRRATDPEIAYESYAKSSGIFENLFTEISEARAAAQARIDAAKQRVAQSEATAVQADKDNPLSQAVEGIEDADAKLLEDDDFSSDQATDLGSLEENEQGAPEK